VARQRWNKSRSRKRLCAHTGAPLPLGGIDFSLPTDLGIEHAAALHATLAPLLATLEPVALRAEAVCRLHAASLQVLAAFMRDRAAAGSTTTWHNPPPLLRESAARAGLDAVLGLTADSPN
jgi:hypothetical protein